MTEQTVGTEVDQSSGGEESELVPRKGYTSVVWSYFGFRKGDVEQKQVLCKDCGRIVSAPQGNTTNLYNHLKKNHLGKYDECMKRKVPKPPHIRPKHPAQTTINATLNLATPYASTSRRHQEITQAVAIYIAKAMAPINTVNNEAFKEMIKTLDKRYEMPSRNYFSKVALPALYKQCREEIRKEIADLPFYATTTDLWSSRTMEPYMSLTIHYIDEDFEIKTRCLQTSFFPEDHTGEAIALEARTCGQACLSGQKSVGPP